MVTTKKPTAKAIEKSKVEQAETLAIERKAKAALKPSVNGASVIQVFQENVMGKDTDINGLIEGLEATCKEVKEGDMQAMEAMLISQATALQSIFTSLARKAHSQTYQKPYEAFLGLALKAQAQSRATITALVDLKNPRQATYVKQANIAHGAQQINNGNTQNLSTQAGTQQTAHYAHTHAPAREIETQQNKLLEAEHGQHSEWMDTRAPQKAKRGHQAVEAVETVHRAKKPRG